MDKEGQTGEEDLYSEKSCCSSCGFYYGERQSESHVEEFSTGEPFTPPNEEKDDVLVLQGMFERIIHNYKEINREASVTLDTMLDELHCKKIYTNDGGVTRGGQPGTSWEK